MQGTERPPKLIHAWHLERIGHPSARVKRPFHQRLLSSGIDAGATLGEAIFFNGLKYLPSKEAFYLSPLAGAVQRFAAGKRSIANMQMVLGHDGRNQSQWRRLWNEHKKHVGTTAIESIQFGSMDREELLDRVELEGESHLQTALKQGRGVMLFINHLGNVGCIPAALGPRGYDISITGNAMPRPYLERKVTELYHHGGVKRILVGEQLPFKAARVFKRNGIFAAFIDYTVVEKLNHWLPFGHAGLNTNLGPAILALRNHAAVLHAVCHRLPNRRHRLTIHVPVPSPSTGELMTDAQALTRQEIAFLARQLQSRPEQWWPWDCAQLRSRACCSGDDGAVSNQENTAPS